MTTQSRLVRVFISSTFRDFIEERDELVKKVFPELRRRAKERFVEILEVDLRWGITEEQSKSGETLRICLEEIDRCRPSAPVFFVGLLGERYGWIPPQDYFKKDVLEDPNLGWIKDHVEGKSVTELEILHGVLRNEKMRDKAFFYFRNDGYQERHWDAIARHHAGMSPAIEKNDFTNAKSPTPAADAEKQKDLKKRVRDVSFKWEPKDYETPQDMAAIILEDLWAAINEVFPASSVPDENDRQQLEHEAFGLSRIKGYVPRLGLFEQLDGVFTSPTSSVKIVTGESGSGKSALLAAWISNLGTRIPERHFIHYIGGTPESASVGSIIRRLMAQIRAWGAVADPIPDDLSDAVELLPTWLQRSAEGQKDGVLIVLDSLNQLDREWDKTLWWLPKDLPEGVRVVASTLTGSSQSALEKRGWTKSSVSVPLLGDDEKRTIIVSYLANFSKSLAGPLADRLVKAPQAANPLFLRVVLDELRLRARHENLASSLDKMLQAKNPVELYVQVLKNLEEFDKDRPNLVREAMGYLAAARRGLTESELLQLLSMADSPATNPLPRHLWSPLYLALEDSLVSRNGQLGFFHDYLRQAVEVEYLDEEWEREKIHGRFGEVAIAYDGEAFSPSLKSYGLARGAWHLRRANDLQKLWLLLSDESYRRAQIDACGSSDYALEGLTEGVEAYAATSQPELQSDTRLAWLAATRAKVQEDARFESIPLAFEEFAAAASHDAPLVFRLLDKLNVLQGEDHFFACQIVLLMYGAACEGRTATSSASIVERVIGAVEEKVAPDTDVEILPGVAEVLANHEIEFIHRFSARSKSSESLISKCAEIKLSEGDFFCAVSLNPKLLPKAIRVLAADVKKEEALNLIGTRIDSCQKESAIANQELLICLKSLQEFGEEGSAKAVRDLLEQCLACIPDISNNALRVSCLCVAGALKVSEEESTDVKEFDYAFAVARSCSASDQRFSSIIETCCAMIEVGKIECALREFDSEIEVFVSSAQPGTDACNFVWEESDGLAEIFKSCETRTTLDRWMSRLVEAIYDPEQMNTDGMFTGVFSEAISELLRKIYTDEDCKHRDWIPVIVDKFYAERPTTDFGEVGSIAAAALASIAAAIGMTSETEKSLRFHALARCEAAAVYHRTGENHFLHCASEAIRSGQIAEAFLYLETFDEHARARGQISDSAACSIADALVENGFLHEAATLIRDKVSADEAVRRKWSRPIWNIIRAFCDKGEFTKCDEFLKFITEKMPVGSDEFSRAAAVVAGARHWKLLEALFEKTASMKGFVSAFLAAWESINTIDREGLSVLATRFGHHYNRLRGRTERAGTLTLTARALLKVGKIKESLSLLAIAYRTKVQDFNTKWNNDSALHEQCLAHLCSTLVEAKLDPLSWAFLPQIRNRKIWLSAFRQLCLTLRKSSPETIDQFLKDSMQSMLQLWEESEMPKKVEAGVVIASPYSVSNIEAVAHAAASIAELGRGDAARKLISVALEWIDVKNDFGPVTKFVPLVLQAHCDDVARIIVEEALVVVANFQSSVSREEGLTALIDMLPQFSNPQERRDLLAKALRIVRKIWRDQSESQNFTDIIYSCARSGEFKLAIVLEKILAKSHPDLARSERIRVFMASEMATQGDVATSSSLLLSLPNSYNHAEAWSNVALRYALAGEQETAKQIYRDVSAARFKDRGARVLTKDFDPVFRSLATLPELDSFKDLVTELTSYPIAYEELWDPIFLIYARSCFTEGERSQIKERFAKDSFDELQMLSQSNSAGAAPSHEVLVKLSNVAVRHLNVDLGWINSLVSRVWGSISGGLQVGRIDFNARLPWIRAFFTVCSANSSSTKMQVTALIAAHGANGNLSEMSSISRSLPQSDIWQAICDAVTEMNSNAANRAKSLEENDKFEEALSVRLSAIKVSGEVLGAGHASVVELADTIQHWPEDEQKFSYYRKALVNSEASYGKNDARFCRLSNKLGLMLFESGEYSEALEFFHAAHDGYRQTFGKDSDDTLSSLFNIAMARRKLGKDSEAIEDLKIVVESRCRLLGDSDLRTLRALDTIAETYISQKKWVFAEEALIKALNAAESPKDKEGTSKWQSLVAYDEGRAQRLLRLAQTLFAQKKFQEASVSVEDSIQLYRTLSVNPRVRGPRRDRVVKLGLRARHLLTDSLGRLGDFNRAIEIQKEVHEILQESKGTENLETLQAQFDLSALFFKSGDYKACETILRALLVSLSDSGSDIYTFTVKALSQCLYKQQATDQALKLVQSESLKSASLHIALRPHLIRLECIAGDLEKAKSLAAEEIQMNIHESAAIKARWLADQDFIGIHEFIKNLET